MASSIYIFNNIETFQSVYGKYFDDVLFKMPLIDIYLKKDKLWIVTNSNDMKEQPRLERTIVHFRSGNVEEWKDGDEKLVKYNDVRFNCKTSNVEFFPRFLRKPLLRMRIGRYFGNVDDKCHDIDYSQRFYDYTNDRIIFVLERKDGKV
tara:strand:- start:652 stop:1098 length:447 start_codon:yes stop_codon:yes gene_type:complete